VTSIGSRVWRGGGKGTLERKIEKKKQLLGKKKRITASKQELPSLYKKLNHLPSKRRGQSENLIIPYSGVEKRLNLQKKNGLNSLKFPRKRSNIKKKSSNPMREEKASFSPRVR